MAEDIHWGRKTSSLLLWLCKLVSCKVGQAACFEKLFSSHLWCIRWQTVLGSLGERFDTCCMKSDSRVLQWKNFPGISFTHEDWCDYGDFEFVDVCWDLPHWEEKVGILLKFLGQPGYSTSFQCCDSSGCFKYIFRPLLSVFHAGSISWLSSWQLFNSYFILCY